MNDGRYNYGYTESGLFTLLDKKGEPLYPKGYFFLDRVLSHLIYITFWTVLILVTAWYCPVKITRFSNPILMSLLMINLFFLGCRLTSLLMIHPLRPLFFPPLWMRLTKQIAKGADITLLEKHNLENHEGLLANLRLARQLMNKNDSIAN